MVPISSYADIATFVFCLALLVLTLNVARNRRNFRSTLQALFLPRVRSQFFRESKLYNEWCFYFGTLFNTLIQGLLVFYLVVTLLPDFSSNINLKWLYILCFGAALFDFFFKFGNSTLLGKLFECDSDAAIFNHSKFFYYSDSSIVLMPILATTIYLGMPAILFVYLPFFVAAYVMMVVRTLTLKSSALSLFQFFLYFCTLEILPYLIILKLLAMLR
ncbi:MAG: DUF4271 domain-containing protein [Bacteroidales bacterium]|nr:DUF4271 domain-containing protein [Bacteroidales bacterium]